VSDTRGRDWGVTRGKGEHFTDAEIEFIRASFRKGRKAVDVARDLKAAIPSINVRYAMLRASGEPSHLDPGPMPTRSRFYKSNFEL
jgi:hypothetical protein